MQINSPYEKGTPLSANKYNPHAVDAGMPDSQIFGLPESFPGMSKPDVSTETE
jgi:hypothetical protein